MPNDNYDIVVIGAGVSGCACARELSRFNAKILVIDKEEDVCCGTSKANSAIVHAGFDAAEGSLMADLNLKGNLAMPKLCKDLDIPFVQNGSIVCSLSKDDHDNLMALYDRGIANGVKDLKILNSEEAHKLEPNLSDKVYEVLYAPTGGIVDPFILTIALAENANVNGVQFQFKTEVENFAFSDDTWTIKTNQGDIKTKYVVNAAGVYAAELHNKVSKKKLNITPRRGDYVLLDKTAGNHVKTTVFMLPSKLGKGILVSPTVHGNLLVGPTAVDIKDPEGTNTTQDGLGDVIEKSALTVKNIPYKSVITSFAGLRAHEDSHEFVIGEVEDAPGFINAAGIESPGLTSAPAIGDMVADIVSKLAKLQKKKNFDDKRKGVLNPEELSDKERSELIKKNPAYSNIICRCESISEAEIVDAIKRPVGAKSLDGVKRRVRAGMGRCQGGFCQPKVMEILARELGCDISDITKTGGKSKVLIGKNKE